MSMVQRPWAGVFSDRDVREADLVIFDGKLLKNRLGMTGAEFPFLEDGCWKVAKMRPTVDDVQRQRNVLDGWDAATDTFKFDSISEKVYTMDDWEPTGLVIGAEYIVSAKRDQDGDLVLTELYRANDDPMLGREVSHHREP